MNLIQKIHGHDHKHDHTHDDRSHTHNAPFWVRYYDAIVGLVTLGRTRKMHLSTIRLANLQPGESILDVGCGTGKLIFAAEKVVGGEGTAVGIDVEAGMVVQAKAGAAKTHSRATFATTSITRIPYPDNSFDVVTSSLVYHHLNQTEKREGLQEVMRVLKPNGRLLIVDLNPTRRGLAVRLPGHNQLAREDYVGREVVAQLEAVGFSNITAGAHPFKQLSYALGVKNA
ncbi:MAG: methyltransferase domain-containing protein [Anaerolineales bacterium]|nr:methyltransferase domain-containing protein [Anaerolineales bacterium]